MSVANGASSGVQLCEELLELATVDLYRNNLFRVLAVPVNTGPAEVRQRQKRLEMQRKLGLSAEVSFTGIFPLTPPPSSETAAKAMERMNDPLARFLDEFFWFSAPPGDAGLAALERGNVTEARNHWKRQPSGSANTVHGLHNLAVMEHILALESTQSEGAASAALAAWKNTLAAETFWDHVRSRVGEMNDVRLTTGFVRRLRDTLPRMKLLIFARQAVAASEQGDTKKTAALLKVIRDSGFDTGIADEVVREALKPLRNRISAAVASSKKHWTKTPQHGDRFARELHQTVQPLLAIHDRVADNDLARQGVHDEVGEAMNLAEVAYCKATNNWAEGEKLLVLAQSVAMGQRLRDQITENIRIDQENAKNGNDWCAPGYWDLAPEVVADLEKARAHAEAGNYDAALDILLAMDKRIGFPLIRVAAYSMSLKAIRASNAALGEYNAESGVIKEIMDKLRAGNGRYRLPSPQMNAFMVPPCLACGSTNYTTWTNFTFNGDNLFMCSSCSSRNERQTEQKKRTLNAALQAPLDYMALAAKLDPQDPGICKNKPIGEKLSTQAGGPGKGDANALAKKLAKQRARRTAVAVGGAATDTCFFCGQHSGDATASITVAMHGPVTRIEFLFGNGTSYDYADVTVSRCPECWWHHSEWPKKIEAWHEAALHAADPEHFPEACAMEASAKNLAETLAKGSALAGQSVERARVALVRAVASQGLFSRLFGRPNPARDTANAALEAAQRQQTMAVGQSQQAVADHKRVQAELLDLRKRAVAAYKTANPQPGLPAGIRPESGFLQAPVIATQQHKSWTFGEKPDDDGGEVTPKGTVSRSPVLRELDAPEVKCSEARVKRNQGKKSKPPTLPPPLSGTHA